MFRRSGRGGSCAGSVAFAGALDDLGERFAFLEHRAISPLARYFFELGSVMNGQAELRWWIRRR